ncbi:hypothetical protein INT45_001285 [Circinella minor]|uniref:F-box domain-containing protein n=1 Tax=Circinella minor TaxID=1195481 RepID=A0A8H7RQL8_9FUNG|nr:hypothetical protein INT45_001285 [Circinella minor]
MGNASPVTTATTIINTAIPIPSFENLKNAYNHHDYYEVIRQATNTIEHIEQSELLWVFERRAYALSMKSEFVAAEHDAKTMIEYAPSLAQGYLCFGKLLSMQGKQKKASKVYEEGLEKVATNDLAYGQLLQAKKRVDEKSNYHFDLVSALPIEIMDEIVKLLSEEERPNLFDVSTIWSQRLENCQEAWKYIYNDHGHDGNMAVSRVLPKIDKHINHLAITATEKEVWLKYLEHLENGYFRNLKSLKLAANIPNTFHTNSTISLMNGFWKTRFTLTKIVLVFHKYGPPITITNILFYLPYLETLQFYVKDSLADVLGELEALQKPHRSLIDLSLSTSSTSGDALKPLTKWCPYVQRLRLLGATPSAIDIVTDYFPNVEMLGYNNMLELPASHKVLNQDYNNKEPIIPVINMDNMYTKQQQGRLRAFYSSNGGRGVSGDEFLRLLQKNQRTLEILHANMSITNQQDMDGEPHDSFRPGYAMKAENTVLNMDRLKKIMYWPDIYEAYEPLFCRMVAPSLTYFESVETFDLSAVVDTLINSHQQLETLAFSHVYLRHNDEENTLDTESWIRLFNEYATTSLPGPNTTRKLRNVMFEYCHNISDDVLDALANIKTIECVGFKGISRITRRGFKDFFIKLNKQNVQITKFILGNMEELPDRDTIFNHHTLLDIISLMNELEELHIYDIDWLIEEDIEECVYTAKKLNTLVVKRCHVDAEQIISSIYKTGRKLKYVKIIDYYDDEFDTYL